MNIQDDFQFNNLEDTNNLQSFDSDQNNFDVNNDLLEQQNDFHDTSNQFDTGLNQPDYSTDYSNNHQYFDDAPVESYQEQMRPISSGQDFHNFDVNTSDFHHNVTSNQDFHSFDVNTADFHHHSANLHRSGSATFTPSSASDIHENHEVIFRDSSGNTHEGTVMDVAYSGDTYTIQTSDGTYKDVAYHDIETYGSK